MKQFLNTKLFKLLIMNSLDHGDLRESIQEITTTDIVRLIEDEQGRLLVTTNVPGDQFIITISRKE